MGTLWSGDWRGDTNSSHLGICHQSPYMKTFCPVSVAQGLFPSGRPLLPHPACHPHHIVFAFPSSAEHRASGTLAGSPLMAPGSEERLCKGLMISMMMGCLRKGASYIQNLISCFAQVTLRFQVPRAPLVNSQKSSPVCKREGFKIQCPKIPTLNAPVPCDSPYCHQPGPTTNTPPPGGGAGGT